MALPLFAVYQYEPTWRRSFWENGNARKGSSFLGNNTIPLFNAVLDQEP